MNLAIQQTVKDVVDIIEDRGYARGVYVDDDGSVCLTQALSLACGMGMLGPRNDQYRVVRRDMVQRLEDNDVIYPLNPGYSSTGPLEYYNDYIVKDQEDLVGTLERLYELKECDS